MLQPNYPANPQERWAYDKIEKLVFNNAARVVVTTEGCRQFYIKRFPDFPASNISTISNGFDPAIFPQTPSVLAKKKRDSFLLLHSGLLYSHERNPSEFFSAVKMLRDNGFFDRINVELRFRASGDDENYKNVVQGLGIDRYVTFLPRVSYSEAIRELLEADALMVFQADNCNDQIPAKVYEYFHAQKPIIGFADPSGETGQLLASVGIERIAKLEDSSEISNQLAKFLEELKTGTEFIVPRTVADGFSRQSLTTDLGRLLDDTVART